MTSKKMLLNALVSTVDQKQTAWTTVVRERLSVARLVSPRVRDNIFACTAQCRNTINTRYVMLRDCTALRVTQLTEWLMLSLLVGRMQTPTSVRSSGLLEGK